MADVEIVPFESGFGSPVRRALGRTLSERTLDRAEQLADLVEIQSHWPFVATVPGREQPSYRVTFSTGDRWRCECLSFQCRFDCAHLRAVQVKLRRRHDEAQAEPTAA